MYRPPNLQFITNGAAAVTVCSVCYSVCQTLICVINTNEAGCDFKASSIPFFFFLILLHLSTTDLCLLSFSPPWSQLYSTADPSFTPCFISLSFFCFFRFRLASGEFLQPHHTQDWPEQQPQVASLFSRLQVRLKPSVWSLFSKRRPPQAVNTYWMCLCPSRWTLWDVTAKSQLHCLHVDTKTSFSEQHSN